MRKAEVRTLPHGLYKIHWESGDQSLASVGSMPNGDRWMAPTNWGWPSAARKHWKAVKTVEYLYTIEDR